MPASEQQNKDGSRNGSGRCARPALSVLLVVGLVMAVAGGVISWKYAAKADRAWNSGGYAKAYREAVLAFERRHPGGQVDRGAIEEAARRNMWLPRNVPAVAMNRQETANIFGGLGFLGLVLAVIALIACICARGREVGGKKAGGKVLR